MIDFTILPVQKLPVNDPQTHTHSSFWRRLFCVYNLEAHVASVGILLTDMWGCVFGCGHWKLCVRNTNYFQLSVCYTLKHTLTHLHTHRQLLEVLSFYSFLFSFSCCLGFEKVFIVNSSGLIRNTCLFKCCWFSKIIALDSDKKAFPSSFTILWIKATECKRHVPQTRGCHKSIFSEHSFRFKLVNLKTLLAAVIWSVCI